MKKLFLSCTFLLSTVAMFAQTDKFQKSMQANLALLDVAKTGQDFTAVAAAFERIGDAEKTQWLPYYYAALAHILSGFTDHKTNKDELADKADALITKAEVLEPKNAEIAVERSMVATLHMLVDPQSRYMEYGAAATKYRELAKQLDPGNPRVYYLEAQNLFGTPVQFGGGKDKARPVFERSIALFKTFKPATSLSPTWGLKGAESMLEQCK